MGFFQRLFGGPQPQSEEQEQRTQERNFNTLRDDGVRAMQMGEVGFAVRCFESALSIKEDAQTQGLLAEACLRQGDFAKALPLLEALAANKADNASVRLLYATTLGRLGRYEEMKSVCDELVKEAATDYAVLYACAEAAHGLNDVFTAIARLTQALELNPNHLPARLLRARILCDMGQAAEAMEDIDVLLKADAENEVYGLLQAEALLQTGQTEEAEAALLRVHEIYPFCREAVLRLGALYDATSRRDKALAVYDEAIELQPDFAEAYKQRGGVRLALHDKEGAADDLRRALELKPEVVSEVEGEFTNVENQMSERYRNMNPYGF
ncbi:MAG: tetratricopeptide repeat protein [Bacteroidaceae bacterium]|nr:tetratricopeptide repeat protein [Bacteroidaceae bacterium]